MKKDITRFYPKLIKKGIVLHEFTHDDITFEVVKFGRKLTVCHDTFELCNYEHIDEVEDILTIFKLSYKEKGMNKAKIDKFINTVKAKEYGE